MQSGINLEKEHLITLVAATGVCNLMELEKLLPDHSKIARHIRKLHTELVDIAGLIGNKLDDHWINVGVDASNAGMKVIKKAIKSAYPATRKRKTA